MKRIRGEQGLESEEGKFLEIAAFVAMERERQGVEVFAHKNPSSFCMDVNSGLLGREDEVSF